MKINPKLEEILEKNMNKLMKGFTLTQKKTVQQTSGYLSYLVGLRRHVVLTGPVVQSVPLVRLVPEVHFHLWDPSHPVGRHFPIDRVPRRRPLDPSLPSDPMDLCSSSNRSYIASDYFSVISAAIQLYESQKYTTYKCIRARRGSILHLLVLADHVVL